VYLSIIRIYGKSYIWVLVKLSDGVDLATGKNLFIVFRAGPSKK